MRKEEKKDGRKESRTVEMMEGSQVGAVLQDQNYQACKQMKKQSSEWKNGYSNTNSILNNADVVTLDLS